MYDPDPSRTATVQYTPRQWVRLLMDEHAWTPTQHLCCYVLHMLGISEQYPDDEIAVSATPREAAMIAAQMRDYAQRGY